MAHSAMQRRLEGIIGKHTTKAPLTMGRPGAMREAPVREYLQLQGRFSHLTEEDIEFMQKNVGRGRRS